MTASELAALPPLPRPTFDGLSRGGLLAQDGYTADQMQAYARAALASQAPVSAPAWPGMSGYEIREAFARPQVDATLASEDMHATDLSSFSMGANAAYLDYCRHSNASAVVDVARLIQARENVTDREAVERAEALVFASPPAPAQEAPAAKCSRCGSASAMACNGLGCFALEGQDSEPVPAPEQPSAAVGWQYEDTLGASYPYDAMFPHSKVIDGVRMFPVFLPTTPREQS